MAAAATIEGRRRRRPQPGAVHNDTDLEKNRPPGPLYLRRKVCYDVYVCVYVGMYVCMSACMCVCRYVCVCVRVCTYLCMFC